MKHKGFSLIEVLLSLTILLSITVMKFNSIKTEQEDINAKVVGEQIKSVGEAVNSYITIKYGELSELKSATGNSDDPGPRVCNANICEITTQTLINNGLLSESFSGKNSLGSGYKIQLRRSGIAPNYVVNGVVTTEQPWNREGYVRYDLLGKAMQIAGADSGVNKSGTMASGYSGIWTAKQSDFSSINKSGQLVYRVGYNSSMYSVYLRRDGTLPMTGDLDLGANNINNIKNINASGDANIDGNVNAGKEITAHNGYGDAITIGGDAVANDYEIRLSNGSKPLTVYSPNAGDYTTIFKVGKNVQFSQRLGLMGRDPNAIPSGWGGGLTTLDVYANGTVAAGNNGNISAYLNSSGNIFASGNIEAQKRVNVGEYVYINGVANIGAQCDRSGLQGRTNEGQIVSCVNGLWALNSGTFTRMGTNSLSLTSPGSYDYVMLTISSKFSGRDGSHTRYTSYNVYSNGVYVGNVYTSQNVRKGGSRGHSWVYEGYGVSMKSFRFKVPAGSNISVSLVGSAYHISTDIRVDLTN